ncbi:putative SOS response-associated peptidase YedK [Herbihabitans rhizosphaerae]|uniref:Abasic site processing protein n=1 Tax=Herbihabitans rhizosphaerae TaxID=1872711 RepID=A0A4Q7KII9_9PSEU|nr:SOS response-associated peptidase [Herbihabitans rhizosphaerae]RZS34025.1 putative SOS response-associated peptidase YedK [Herbihabitans rhizosphaerae]
MCGRYAAKKDPATLAAEFDAVDQTDGSAPGADYNVAPTKSVVTVVQRHPRDEDGKPDPEQTVRGLRVMRWGLIPGWAKSKSIGAKMINARVESAATKPAFRSAMKRKRCLIPADGWFEWRRDGQTKQPFYMTDPDGKSLAMAGLWSTWRDPEAAEDAPPLITCSVLTTDAIGRLTDIHDRMPLLLSADAWQGWLDPDREDVADLIGPPMPELVDALELRPVSDTVNNVRNNGPELLNRVDPAQNLDEPSLFDVEEARP